MYRNSIATAAIACAVALCAPPATAADAAYADSAPATADREPALSKAPATGEATELSEVRVTGAVSGVEMPRFPATVSTIDAAQVATRVNAVDVEDAVKYLPSLFVRKRNYGDTQPVLATRTWGVNSSARSLVLIDDIPISALIANNNTLGAPRWGVISPEQIDHVDMLYGPYSAAYSGNAIGGVLRIATRTPEQTEVTFKQIEALQSFDLYGTRDDYRTHQTSATAGGRSGAWSWFVGANLQDSSSHPLSFITSATTPAGTIGAIAANNKLGVPANVLGAGGLLDTRMAHLNGKFSYDLHPFLRATYLVGAWTNDARSHAQTYLTDADGRPTWGNAGGFASNTYLLDATHRMQGLSLKSDSDGRWDGEAVLTWYDILRDRQRSPAGVGSGTDFTPNGRLADLEGTGWATLDLKGVWRPGDAHELAFGVHADEYTLKNPTRNTAVWRNAASVGNLHSEGRGRTVTRAAWMQDAWSFAPGWQATLGLRYEQWDARDGYNFSGGTGIRQPDVSANAWSPKATLSWNVAPDWLLTASLAKSTRFATVGELYQLVSTGSTFTAPNPDLQPERVRNGELAFERTLDQGSLRISLFQENARDALVAQTSTVPDVVAPVTFVTNVGEIRNRGLEIAAQRNDFLVDGLELSGSVTFVDSTILSNDRFSSPGGTTSVGKHAPYVPRWRATVVGTWRPDTAWAFTIAARYSGRMYSTVDNIDTTAQVFGAFDRFLVVDARAHWEIDPKWSASLGIDNLGNKTYFLYHPFPQRTFVADIRLKL